MTEQKIIQGDCLEVMKKLPNESVDAVICDPPYELGFMGKAWDSTGIANNVEVWQEALRVLKPGGHLLAFSGTRTYHRMAVAIEDAGFEVRDMINWTYGSGFPKSLSIGKAINKLETQEWSKIGKALDNIDQESKMEVWKRYLDNAKSATQQLSKSKIIAGQDTPREIIVQAFAVVKDKLEDCSSPVNIAKVYFTDHQANETKINTVLQNVEAEIRQIQDPAKFAELLSQNPNPKSWLIFTAECDVKDWLKENTEVNHKVDEALKTLRGNKKYSNEEITSVLCVALTDILKHTILNQSKTFQSLDTSLKTECVSAINVIITEYIMDNLISNTVDILKSKAVDKLQGNEREELGRVKRTGKESGTYGQFEGNNMETKGTSEWEGWGTSLKPSHEPVICCAKPLTLELIFAKMGIDITNEIINLCQKYNVNVNDVEQALNSIHLKLEKVGVNTVAENARTCDWENIESVVIAGMSFTSPKPISKEPPEGYKVVSAPISVNQNGNEYLQENGTLIGTAEDLSEQMDILLSTLATGNIDSNTAWLWKSILENVLQKAGTFTTSMALKTTIAWKTYKSLLSANTPNFTSPNKNLKPAHEPICMARKPLAEKTVALNVLKYGTGGINIDDSRVGTEVLENGYCAKKQGYMSDEHGASGGAFSKDGMNIAVGRFPANLIHDNSEEVRECFPEAKSGGKVTGRQQSATGDKGIYGKYGIIENSPFNDSGNASRFFKSIIYQAKASKSERNKGCEELEEKQMDESRKEGNPGGDNPRNRGVHSSSNNHPTVKPIALMEYLIRMTTREGQTILDPFAGSGTTGVACKNLNRACILIEKEETYVKIAQQRLDSTPTPMF